MCVLFNISTSMAEKVEELFPDWKTGGSIHVWKAI